jgi:hypothetical protein
MRTQVCLIPYAFAGQAISRFSMVRRSSIFTRILQAEQGATATQTPQIVRYKPSAGMDDLRSPASKDRSADRREYSAIGVPST